MRGMTGCLFLGVCLSLASAAATLCVPAASAAEDNRWPIGFWPKNAGVEEGTYVVVDILDKGGRIVRHLAGGTVGISGPWPFIDSACQQWVDWDLKDDRGKKVSGGRYTARLRAGLEIEFDSVLGHDPYVTGYVTGIATDRKGRLYVFSDSAWRAYGKRVRVYDREGNYLYQLIPAPPDENGQVERPWWRYPFGFEGYESFALQVDERGNLWIGTLGHQHPGVSRLFWRVDEGGKAVWSITLKPMCFHARRMHLAIDAEGSLYYSDGAERDPWEMPSGRQTAMKDYTCCIYKVRDDFSPANDFLYSGKNKLEKARDTIGAFGKEGDGPEMFRGPAGVGVDGQGNIYVADSGNDCIKVYRKDGLYLYAIKEYEEKGGRRSLTNPVPLEFDRGMGCFYVIVRDGGARKLVKMIPGENPRTVWTLELDYQAYRQIAVDTSEKPAVLWVAHGGGMGTFTRIADKGDSVGEVKHFGGAAGGKALIAPYSVAVDARDRLYVDDHFLGVVRMNGSDGGDFKVLVSREDVKTNEHGGWLLPPTYNQKVRAAYPGSIKLGPDGLIYRRFCGRISRHDPETGEVVPFSKDRKHIDIPDERPDSPPSEASRWDFAVDGSGNVYVGAAGERVDLYGPDGEVRKEGFVQVNCPRALCIDSEGSLCAIGLRAGRPYLFRFHPEGGQATGAGLAWARSGVGPVPGAERCTCPSAKLGVGPFGDIFVPVASPGESRIHINVFDRGGNLVLSFGGRGNEDCRGPKSKHPKPEIPLRAPLATAVGDESVYVSDYGNARIVRCRLVYKVNKEIGSYDARSDEEKREGIAARLVEEGKSVPEEKRPEIIRVNCGGISTEAGGVKWADDGGFSTEKCFGLLGKGGGKVQRPHNTRVANTSMPELYLTERFSMDGYGFLLKPGSYTMRLHFNDWHSGSRVFDVFIGEKMVLEDFDISREAGGIRTAVVKEFKGIDCPDGVLTISFKGKKSEPCINAIEVIRE